MSSSDGAQAPNNPVGVQQHQQVRDIRVEGQGNTVIFQTTVGVPGDGQTAGATPLADWTKLLHDPCVYEELSRFRSLFSRASEQISLLTWYKTLHDKFQELERPYKVLLRERKRLGSSTEAWDEVQEFMAATREGVGALELVLEQAPIVAEFAMCKQQLGDARKGLEAAEGGTDAQILNRALKSLKESLARYPSKANDRLMALAQSLPLQLVVQALRSAHGRLVRSAPDASELRVMGQEVEALDALHRALTALLDEHNRWQGIDNELRWLADNTTGSDREAMESSWPLIRTSVADLVKSTGATAAWAVGLGQIGDKLDAELVSQGSSDAERERGTVRLRQLIGAYFRGATTRFEDVDKMLLKTCEKLEQKGKTLDSVLRVLDGK